MRRHSANSVVGAILLLGCGTALTVISHRWGTGADHMSQMAACIGPLSFALGVGLVVHGVAMPLDRISVVARAWGIAGSIAAGVDLWLLGYYQQGASVGRAVRVLMPVVLVAAWLLPARFYGDAHPPQESPLGKGR